MAANKVKYEDADFDKAEADAMRVLGTMVRSTRTEPENRIRAAHALLTHVRNRAMDYEMTSSVEVEQELEEI